METVFVKGFRGIPDYFRVSLILENWLVTSLASGKHEPHFVPAVQVPLDKELPE